LRLLCLPSSSCWLQITPVAASMVKFPQRFDKQSDFTPYFVVKQLRFSNQKSRR
jgi:hypothetical protein